MKTVLKLILLLEITLLLMSCDKDDSMYLVNKIDVTIENSEDYNYDFNISGDEEGAVIIIQAKHFQVSELIRNSSTNWNVVYQYKPEANYVGADYVEIETCNGGQGVNCTNTEIVRINFTITD